MTPAELKIARRRIALDGEMKWVLCELGDWMHDFLPSSDLDKETKDLEKLVFNSFKINMSKETTMYPDLVSLAFSIHRAIRTI